MNHRNGKNGLVKRTKLRKNRARSTMRATLAATFMMRGKCAARVARMVPTVNPYSISLDKFLA